MDEIRKDVDKLANRITRLETLLTGSNGNAGLFSVVSDLREKQKEIRAEQKSHAKFQNILLGALIVLNIILPIALQLFTK